MNFIPYLDEGNYFGIDQDPLLLEAAVEIELPAHGVTRRPTLICRDDFNFGLFGTTFDYLLAQSVFTHLPWNAILRCLANVPAVLNPDGRFYATFFEGPPGDYVSPLQPTPRLTTYPDRDPFHYEFSVFEELAQRVGLQVKRAPHWQHPRNQQMMIFSRRSGR